MEPPSDTKTAWTRNGEPGGETDSERREHVTHENTDAQVDQEVGGTCRDMRVGVESAET